MQYKFLLKLGDNRITRPLKSSLIRLIVSRLKSREVLNAWYGSIDENAKSRFYLKYAKIFRDVRLQLQPGEWRVFFLGKEIKLPLRSDFSWLDWDNAVSIIGHELEIKQTYAAILASDQRPELFVDVGANYGMHSLLFLSAGVPVMAFEPNPNCAISFEVARQLNGFSVSWEAVAIGDSPGTAQLVYPERETWLGSVSIDIASSLRERGEVQVQQTQIKRLDDFFDEMPPGSMLMKIDVEGLELDVLNGASRILTARRPRIIFESNSHLTRAALQRILEGNDYSIYSLPWSPSPISKPLKAEEFIASQAHNFIAVGNNTTGT